MASTTQPTDPRVVLVHDWLTGMRGGEKCLLPLTRRWPGARLFTLLHKKGSVAPDIERLRPSTSWLGHLPRVERYYRYLLPLMPHAVSRLRIPPADLVVSFSHCVAKGVRAPAGVPHVCYCFTPMRYAWHLRQSYFGGRVRGWPARLISRMLDRLRDWDRETAAGVTHFIAISETIRTRIRECYGRESEIIHPPADTAFYSPAPVEREDYYLAVSALAPYKRIDLAMAACARLGRPLVVIGSGQDAGRLAKVAGGNVRMLGWQPDEVIRGHLRRCKALLFPGEEDFGIVPVEAMACGTPVVALGKGGATETVVPLGAGGPAAPTGVWFEDQSVEALAEGIEAFERHRSDIDPAACRQQALQFSESRYTGRLFDYLDRVLAGAAGQDAPRKVA